MNLEIALRRLIIPTLVGAASRGAMGQAARAPAALVDARDTMMSFGIGGWGLSLTDGDRSVRPGEDFNRFQNGAWLAENARLGIDRNNSYWRDLMRLPSRRVTRLLGEIAADRNAAQDSPEGKAGAFYRAFMDTTRIKARGIRALEPALARIRSAHTHTDLARVMGEEAGAWTPRPPSVLVQTFPLALFSLAIDQDPRAPKRSAVIITSAGLLLPAPSYYSDPRQADIRDAYVDYVTRMLRVLQWESPEIRARQILDLETRLATASVSLEERRDQSKLVNMVEIRELGALAPGFEWREFMAGAGLSSVTRVVIDSKSTCAQFARIFAETPVEVWQARQAFAIADLDAPKVNDDAAAAALEFRSRRFNGSAASQSRELRVMMAVDASIPGIVVDLYAKRYFTPSARRVAREMAENIRAAFDARLASSKVLNEESRQRARAKLAAMQLNIGAPEHMMSYKGLAISDTDYFGNLLRARAFEWERQRSQLDKPFDRAAWPLRAYDANYAYSWTSNAMVVTAAALEPPFFDISADPAVNYGAIGTLIGSQIAAGFDDNGRHFGADGGLLEVLSEADASRFESMRDSLAAEYSKVEPMPGLHIPGGLVVNEAIADIIGIQIALDAYHQAQRGRTVPVLDGLTGDQRFFLGRAQMWRALFVPAFYRLQAATGHNAPPFQRINGPIPHIDSWYDAFAVSTTDRLYLPPARRLHFLF